GPRPRAPRGPPGPGPPAIPRGDRGLVTATRSVAFRALGTTAVVLVAGDTDAYVLADAAHAVEHTTNAFDQACSRFREDSELIGLRRSQGRPMTASPLLVNAV